ncbi:MAG: adenine deaminase [Flavobacteriia bacterium]|nr:adenine deaminase [Flavobacteriia bacterium]
MQCVEGSIVDVINKTIKKGCIYFDRKIIKIEYKNVESDLFIIPGFIDAHIHVESSMLVPSEFARLAVLHGTVATISDPHEIGNVLGVDGVKFMIENGKKTPFKFFFGAPSCVPATKFETAGAEINEKDIDELMSWKEIVYLAEMMNFPAVLKRETEVMNKIQSALKRGKKVDGHAPGLKGEDAKNYIDAGISTDHECFTLEEALDKIKYGMKILIREGSAAKNFEALYPLIDLHPEMVMFCSDDKHPNDLVKNHINVLAKRAIQKGCNVMNVLQICSKNVVDHYQIPVGLLQIDDAADFCIVKDLNNFDVHSTFINGQCVSKNYETYIPSIQTATPNYFSCNLLQTEQLKIKAQQEFINVIEVEDGQLITKKGIHKAHIQNGFLESNTENDLLKLVVINRYENQKPAFAFIKNVGLKKGAIASCVAHDSHNIIAVGCNDEDLKNAINLIINAKGGVSLADKDKQLCVELPVGGIMSNKDAYLIADEYENIDIEAKNCGCTLNSPFMTLSFCALLVIPELKLSDKGLFDGNSFQFIDLQCEK